MMREEDDAEPTLSRRHSVGAASARSLLLTILGEFVLPTAEPVWTSAVVNTMAGLAIEEKAARQALARTAADGLIVALKHGRQVRWHLTAAGRRLLTDGAERIYSFAAQGPGWDGRWLVLTVTVPEGQRQLRRQLRTRLTWAGFGNPAPSVWVTTDTAREAEAKQILNELGLTAAAYSFTGPFGSIGSPRTLVDQAWELDAVAKRYQQFIVEFAGMRPQPGEESMLTQIRLVHEWRRFPFLDPQLPAELLPPNWIGKRAAALFAELHGRWHKPAQRHWRQLVS
ncbi:MAG TPA: PaaX family transcriptional regulator C-terminal domain-containing protein [Candidatus Limnocylindrales bacterium]